MWLFTEGGFVSAVRHRKDKNKLVVRARDEISLSELATYQEVIFTPHADYPYRVIIDEREFRTFVDKSIKNLSYDNFKNRVYKTRGAQFVDALHDVWATMHKVEDLRSANRWDNYPTAETLPGFDDSPENIDFDNLELFPDWEPNEKS